MPTPTGRSGDGTIAGHPGDRGRVVRPRGSANFHLQIIVVVNLLNSSDFAEGGGHGFGPFPVAALQNLAKNFHPKTLRIFLTEPHGHTCISGGGMQPHIWLQGAKASNGHNFESPLNKTELDFKLYLHPLHIGANLNEVTDSKLLATVQAASRVRRQTGPR